MELLPKNRKSELARIYTVKDTDPAEKVSAVKVLFEEASIPRVTRELIAEFAGKAARELDDIGGTSEANKDNLRQFTQLLLKRDY